MAVVRADLLDMCRYVAISFGRQNHRDGLSWNFRVPEEFCVEYRGYWHPGGGCSIEVSEDIGERGGLLHASSGGADFLRELGYGPQSVVETKGGVLNVWTYRQGIWETRLKEIDAGLRAGRMDARDFRALVA